MTFVLHPQLEADTFPITESELSELRLMNDARYPWTILIPKLTDLSEWHDVPQDLQSQIWESVAHCSRTLDALFQPTKMNIAALGNMVPQLHIHILARFADDPAWPQPVWGVGTAVPYSAAERDERISAIRNALT